jgi:peptidoglycan/xylan/chitin deacetylase (PgdA/CDA1 family)
MSSMKKFFLKWGIALILAAAVNPGVAGAREDANARKGGIFELKQTLRDDRKTLHERDYGMMRRSLVFEFEDRAPHEWTRTLPGVKTRLNTKSKVLALTVDLAGARDSGYASKLVEYLETQRIPATLFVSGEWIYKNPKIFRRLSRNPVFEIANGGLRHKPSSVSGKSADGIQGTSNVGEAVDEIELNARKIQGMTGKMPKYYRSGRAYYDDMTVQIAERLGYQSVGFSAGGDTGAYDSKEKVREAMRNSTPGSIILCRFSPSFPDMTEGILEAIPLLAAKGYRFVKLSDYPLD